MPRQTGAHVSVGRDAGPETKQERGEERGADTVARAPIGQQPWEAPTGMPIKTTSAEIMRSDQHHDVLALCLTCLIRWYGRAGHAAPSKALFSFGDFKNAWKDLKFSHVYGGKPKSSSTEGYMQQLYDGCFQVAVVQMEAADVEKVVESLKEAKVVGSESSENGHPGLDIEEIVGLFNHNQEVKDQLALFALGCCFGAQPSHGQHQMVLVRVEERYFEIFERWTEYVEGASGRQISENKGLQDFLLVYMSLWKRNAFVFGSNLGFTPFQSGHLISEEDTEKERALVKDLRFHLSSTLRGMGLGKVEELCREYAASLRNVLVSAEDSYDDRVGIADLEFGTELSRLEKIKSEMIHYTLYGDGGEGRFFAGLGKTTSSKRQSQSASLSKVMQREKARKLDIQEKKKLMEEAIGLEGDEEVEDMPDLLEGLDDLIPNVNDDTDA